MALFTYDEINAACHTFQVGQKIGGPWTVTGRTEEPWLGAGGTLVTLEVTRSSGTVVEVVYTTRVDGDLGKLRRATVDGVPQDLTTLTGQAVP